MSQENLELVRSLYAAWERGDWGPIEWAYPQIQWVSADGPSPGTWTGLESMAEGWRDWLRLGGTSASRSTSTARWTRSACCAGRGQRAGQGERLGTRADAGRKELVLLAWESRRLLAAGLGSRCSSGAIALGFGARYSFAPPGVAGDRADEWRP